MSNSKVSKEIVEEKIENNNEENLEEEEVLDEETTNKLKNLNLDDQIFSQSNQKAQSGQTGQVSHKAKEKRGQKNKRGQDFLEYAKDNGIDLQIKYEDKEQVYQKKKEGFNNGRDDKFNSGFNKGRNNFNARNENGQGNYNRNHDQEFIQSVNRTPDNIADAGTTYIAGNTIPEEFNSTNPNEHRPYNNNFRRNYNNQNKKPFYNKDQSNFNQQGFPNNSANQGKFVTNSNKFDKIMAQNNQNSVQMQWQHQEAMNMGGMQNNAQNNYEPQQNMQNYFLYQQQMMEAYNAYMLQLGQQQTLAYNYSNPNKVDNSDESVLQVLEYYFSETNLNKDFYLRTKLDSEGFILAYDLLNFNKLKAKGVTLERIEGLFEKSPSEIIETKTTQEGVLALRNKNWDQFRDALVPIEVLHQQRVMNRKNFNNQRQNINPYYGGQEMQQNFGWQNQMNNIPNQQFYMNQNFHNETNQEQL